MTERERLAIRARSGAIAGWPRPAHPVDTKWRAQQPKRHTACLSAARRQSSLVCFGLPRGLQRRGRHRAGDHSWRGAAPRLRGVLSGPIASMGERAALHALGGVQARTRRGLWPPLQSSRGAPALPAALPGASAGQSWLVRCCCVRGRGLKHGPAAFRAAHARSGAAETALWRPEAHRADMPCAFASSPIPPSSALVLR